MSAYRTINPLALPSVSLKQRSQLPTTPCIYFAIDNQGVVHYVGRSINLRKRWVDHHHHRLDQLSELTDVRLAWFEVGEITILPVIEVALIRWFRPVLNGSTKTSIKTAARPKRAKPDQYSETKQCYMFMLTATASEEIERTADKLGITRSDALEIVIRSGGMHLAEDT